MNLLHRLDVLLLVCTMALLTASFVVSRGRAGLQESQQKALQGCKFRRDLPRIALPILPPFS
jgi:hypothetical protein